MNKVNKEIQQKNKEIQEANKEIQQKNKEIEDKKKRKTEIDQLLNQISTLQNLIAQNKIIYKILNLQDIKNDEIFKANREALVGENGNSGLLRKITNAQSKLLNINIPQNTTQPQSNQDQGQTTLVKQPTGQQPQGTIQHQKRPQGQGNTGNPAPGQPQGKDNPVQGQRTDKVNTSSEISVPTSTFLLELKEKVKYDIDKEEEQIRQKIKEELNELENLKNQTPRNEEKIEEIQKKINGLFTKGNYTLSDDLQEQFAQVKVPELEFTDQEKYFLLRFISLLTLSGNFEAGLEVLNKKQNLKNIIIVIFTTQDHDVRQKKLIELYEQRPNRNLTEGGKYKKKKSKKSKKSSKTSKAKSTKKQKAPRTQVKSYNNPKYKNQDGGFVRGGVLFPESFYRSDIVM